MNGALTTTQRQKHYETLRQCFGDAYAERVAMSTNQERLELASRMESLVAVLRRIAGHSIKLPQDVRPALN